MKNLESRTVKDMQANVKISQLTTTTIWPMAQDQTNTSIVQEFALTVYLTHTYQKGIPQFSW